MFGDVWNQIDSTILTYLENVPLAPKYQVGKPWERWYCTLLFEHALSNIAYMSAGATMKCLLLLLIYCACFVCWLWTWRSKYRIRNLVSLNILWKWKMKVLDFIEIMILSADGFLKLKSISRLQYTKQLLLWYPKNKLGLEFNIHNKLLT